MAEQDMGVRSLDFVPPASIGLVIPEPCAAGVEANLRLLREHLDRVRSVGGNPVE